MNEKLLKELSLDNLTEFHIKGRPIEELRREAEIKQAPYKEKYGDKWWEEYVKDTCGMPRDYDEHMKNINVSIYEHRWPGYIGTPQYVSGLYQKWRDRCEHLYGSNFEDVWIAGYTKENAARVLLDDAVKTGKWKELPDCLQGEYHKRVGGAL